jgi:predicted DCC family thiol-disulfide oxidoreductase YuxK
VITSLTVLYDEQCPLCHWVREWLEARTVLVPLRFVPVGSRAARSLYPALDHDRTRAEVTVISDRGELWTAEAAWVMCLWATAEYRALAEWLAAPSRRAVARRVVLAVARRTASRPRPAECGYGDACVG